MKKIKAKRNFFSKFLFGARIFLIILLLLLGASFTYEKIMQSKAQEQYPPPGKLVDVGGYDLHILQQGTGSPTIIFETGSGAPSTYWKNIVSELPSNVTVITYDRAGYNWSDKHVTKRTGENIVKELHTALDKLDLKEPYIFVGHSIGGLYTRLYAKMYPSEVAGMMLLDARSENFGEKSDQILVDAGVDPATFGTTPVGLIKALRTTGLLRVFKEPIFGNYYESKEEVNEAINLMFTTKFLNAMKEENELLYLVEENLKDQHLGNIPLTVVAKGVPSDLTTMGLSKEASTLYEDIWMEEQQSLAGLSSNSKFLIADKSGHDIAIDEPELVLKELEDLIERVENNNTN
ncbi:alpha/beta fold hydrolase [Fredinandcohnia humi]